MPPVLIFGAGPYAKLLRKLAEDAGRSVCCFVTDPVWRKQDGLDGLPLVEWHPNLAGEGEWLVGVGYRSMKSRAAVADRITGAGGRLAVIKSHEASIARTANIKSGAVIFPGCVVEHGAVIGNNVTLWSGSIACHDVIIDSHTYIAPGAVLSGNCCVGSSCFLGTRVTAIDGLVIGRNCRIDAGSLLTVDAADDGHYRGVPARRIGEVNPVLGITIMR